MKFDLNPTEENVKETYLKDAIGRNDDVFIFANTLNNIDTNCSIALDGDWGSGKTFFVKQVKLLLDACNPNVEMDEEVRTDICNFLDDDDTFSGNPQICAYYDAWDNDNDEDPILSIVASIVCSTAGENVLPNNPLKLYGLAAAIADYFPLKSGELLKALKCDNPLDGINAQKDLRKAISDFFEELLVEKGNRLVVFVDELDRCNPRFAVSLLERIKHYFTNDRITFVFSINTTELQHTIKSYYGNEFDAYRYLDRFFDLRFSLPPVDKDRYFNHLWKEKRTFTYEMIAEKVAIKYNLSMREISRYANLLEVAAYSITHTQRFDSSNTVQFCSLYIVPIALGLKMSSSNAYKAFVEGRDEKPILILLECISKESFSDLLDIHEGFERIGDDRTTVVSCADKLRAVYDALFVQQYDKRICYKGIGKCIFNENVRRDFFKIIGLISERTDITQITTETT